jgi:hypothetical protein
MQRLSFMLRAAYALFFSSMLVACEDDNKTKDPLVIPSAYDGAAFTTNAAAQLTARTALINLTNEMKKGRVNGTKVDLTALTNFYTQGTPSLKSYTTSFYNAKIEGANGYLSELNKASGGTFTPDNRSGNGGTYGGYLFDENGVEMEQMVEKGLFGAALYNQAVVLMKGHAGFTPANADQLLAFYGASVNFNSSDDAAKHGASVDRFMANYAARRDKNDGKGLYTQLKTQFIRLQAAAKQEPNYHDDLLNALDQIASLWEKANAATVINYCHSAVSTLSSTSTTEAQKGAALHSLNEAMGFLQGWKTIDAGYRRITDAQIDEYLALLNVPATGTPTPYSFLTDPVNQLPKLQQLISKLQTLYQFSTQDVEDFKRNWVKEQGR